MEAGRGGSEGIAPRAAALLVGVPRSGTTLLLRLLDGHPDLLILPHESHAADWHAAPDPARGFRDRRRLDGPYFPDGPRADALEERLRLALPGPSDVGAALRALADAYARVLPAPPGLLAWVEKTPKHLARVPEIRRALGGDVRFLCVVRDPRAVAASQFTLWKRGGARQVRTFAARWAAADILARRFEAAVPGFRTIRYEDLVAEPERAMRGVAAHLGVPWHPCLLEPTDRGAPWNGNASSRAARTGITLEPEQGMRALSPGEERLVERLLAPRMRARGYEPRDPAAAAPSPARAWIELVARYRIRGEVEAIGAPPGPAPRQGIAPVSGRTAGAAGAGPVANGPRAAARP